MSADRGADPKGRASADRGADPKGRASANRGADPKGRASGFRLDAPREPAGGTLATALQRNRAFAAAGGHRNAVVLPRLRLFVVSCLDPRTDPAHLLGLGPGDALVARTAGGRVTRQVIEEVALIAQLAERAIPDGPLFEVAVIHHTQCGTGALADPEFRERYAARIGAEPLELAARAVIDPLTTVVRDVELLRAAPEISARVTASGHVYDVTTGLVETVVPAAC